MAQLIFQGILDILGFQYHACSIRWKFIARCKIFYSGIVIYLDIQMSSLPESCMSSLGGIVTNKVRYNSRSLGL